jgi:hypothetical protein
VLETDGRSGLVRVHITLFWNFNNKKNPRSQLPSSSENLKITVTTTQSIQSNQSILDLWIELIG